jgi:uncharacterized protein
VIVDTSVLFAYFVRSDPAHEVCTGAVEGRQPHEDLVVSPLVIAELDYLVASRFGVAAELNVLRELSSGAWEIAALDVDDLGAVAKIVEKYGDQDVGATDASLVVLAAKHGTRTIATLDRRHFGVMRSTNGKAFQIVP